MSHNPTKMRLATGIEQSKIRVGLYYMPHNAMGNKEFSDTGLNSVRDRSVITSGGLHVPPYRPLPIVNERGESQKIDG